MGSGSSTSKGSEQLTSVKFGGLETVADAMKMGILSNKKRSLIKKIATILTQKLKIKGIDDALASDDIDKIVDALDKNLPGGKVKAGEKAKGISQDPKVQEKTCQVLGDAINETLGEEYVGRDLSAQEKCKSIREFMLALTTGITEEIVIAKKDLERSIKNIQIILDLMDKNYTQLIGTLKKCDELSPQAGNFMTVYKPIKAELTRQMEILKLMLDTIVYPTEKDINELLDTSKNLKEFRDVSKLGTTTMSREIAAALRGATLTSIVAAKVDKALTQLGLKYADIKKLSVGELESLFSSKINTLLAEKDEASFEKVRKAIELIKNNLYLVKTTEEINGAFEGGCPTCGGEPEECGGAEVVGGLKLDKRVDRRDKTIKILVEAFNRQMHDYTQKILNASKQFAKVIASGRIEQSDTLRKFAKSLELLPDLEKHHMYFSISGLYTDVSARQDRERFISSALHIVSAIDELLKLGKSKEGFDNLQDMKLAFNRIVELINAYVKKFAEGFGPITSWEEYKMSLGEKVGGKFSVSKTLDKLKEGWQKNIKPILKNITSDTPINNEVEKKDGESIPDNLQNAIADTVIEGGDINASEIARIGYNLKDAINTILYYYRTSLVRHNLNNFVKEHQSYSEDYVKILADAVADGIDNITEEKNKLEKEFKKDGEFYKGIVDPAHVKDDEKKLGKIKRFILSMYDAKEKMFRTAEVIDLYMKEFSESIAADPDTIKDIMSILDHTEMIAQWFSEDSGDMLCQVFDEFPAKPDKISSLSDKKTETAEHYYVRVVGMCGLDTFTNLQTNFPEIGSAVVPPALVPTAWIPTNTFDIGFAKNVSLPGNPFLPVKISIKSDIDSQPGTAERVIENIKEALNIGVLKNLIAAFFNIGDKFGNKELVKKIHMSPKQILKNLYDYLTYSSLLNANTEATLPANFAVDYDNDITPSDIGLKTTGDQIEVGEANVKKSAELINYVIMRPAGSAYKNITSSYKDIFADTDKLYVLVMKSIIAKILTTIGVYNMFNRPINSHGLGYFDGMRLILGGDDSKTAIIDDALELYIRLPLLAEFYKNIFNFDDEKKTITMIPEMSGTFSGLIKIIFDTSRHVVDGNYSDTEIRMIIEEINKIYSSCKSSANIIQTVIDNFIAEINRRYGLLKSEERIKYNKMRNEKYKMKYETPKEITDFSIKGIDEDDTYSRPAPSDAYRGKGISIDGDVKHKYKIDDENRKQVQDLRNNIDKLFRKAESTFSDLPDGGEKAMEHLKEISFEPLITARREELKYAKTNDEKYKIIQTTISSLGKFVISALEKSFLSFHETVVMGLHTLYVLYQLLNNFKVYIEDISTQISTGIKSINDIDLGDLTAYGDLPVIVQLSAVAPSLNAVVERLMKLQIAYSEERSDKNKKTLIDALVRFIILKHQDNFTKLFEHLFAHASTLDGLVNFQIESKKVNKPDGSVEKIEVQVGLDHSKLRELIYSTFNGIKENIDKYRGILPKETIDKYTEKNNKGSLYWIEQNLIDDLIEGKKDTGSSDVVTLDKLGTKVQIIVDYLTKNWPIDMAGNLVENFTDFTDEINKLIYCNIKANPMSVLDSLPADGPAEKDLLSLLYNTSGQKKKNIESDYSWYGQMSRNSTLYKTKRSDWYSDGFRGLIFTFNRLLACYVNQIYDDVARKVYQPALNEFANGAFSDSIIGNKYYDDIAFGTSAVPAVVPPFVLNMDLQDKIIFKSISLAIKQLITEKVAKGDVPEYLESNMVNIPYYMKERYRTNLPILLKMFKYLNKRADMIKNFTKALSIPAAQTDKINTTSMINIIDRISSGIGAIIKCITITMQDLNDTPKFLETYKDFIIDYEGANGKLPFMPHSSMAYLYGKLGYKNGQPTDELAPIYSVGNEHFKFLYGVRGILNNEKSGLEDFPGMKVIATEHNSSTDAKYHIDMKKLDKFIQEHTQLAKYIVDTTVYRDFMSTSGPGASTRLNHCLIDLTGTITQPYQGMNNNVDLLEIVKMTENNFQREERGKIVKYLENKKGTISTQDRETMLVFNIIDLNIVPINVHALMREIPLINLYNYSYTFDKLITEVFSMHDLLSNDENKYTIDDVGMPLTANNALHLMGLMLLHPYHEITRDDYDKHFARIVRGALGVEGLERPRYLSDQVYGKALFGEIYEGDKMKDEAGPPFGHSHGEGKVEVLTDEYRKQRVFNNIISIIAIDYARSNLTPLGITFTSLKDLEKDINYITEIVLNSMFKNTVIPNLLTDDNIIAVAKTNAKRNEYIISLMYIIVTSVNIIRSPIRFPHLDKIDVNKFKQVLTVNMQSVITDINNDLTDYAGTANLDKYFTGTRFSNLGPWWNTSKANVYVKVKKIPTTTTILNSEVGKSFEQLFKLKQVKKVGENYFPNKLHFLGKEDHNKISIKEVPFGVTYNFKPILQQIGKFRFDTRLVRNIIWLVNIQRVLRLKLSRDLRWYDSKVVSNHSMLAPSITEIYNNDAGHTGYTNSQYY